MPKKQQIKNKGNSSEPVAIDFGNRKISDQNFSKMIAIPKDALRNCSNGNAMSVNVKLIQQNGEKYLKLTPRCEPIQKGGRSK